MQLKGCSYPSPFQSSKICHLHGIFLQTLTQPIVERSKQSNLVDEFQFVACALAIAVDAIQ